MWRFVAAGAAAIGGTSLYYISSKSDKNKSSDRSRFTSGEAALMRDRFLHHAHVMPNSAAGALLLSGGGGGSSVDPDALLYASAMTVDEFVASLLLHHGIGRCDHNHNENKKDTSGGSGGGGNCALLRPKVKAKVEALFKKLDANHDGVLSYGEYCLLFSLLSGDERLMKTAFVMFDADGSGLLDPAEFTNVMRLFSTDATSKLPPHEANNIKSSKNKNERGKSAYGSGANKPSSSSSQVSSSTSSSCSSPTTTTATTSFEEANSGMLQHFFGPKKDRKLSYETFSALVKDLRRAVQEAEFDVLDVHNTGFISLDLFRHFFYGNASESKNSNSDDNKGAFKNANQVVSRETFFSFCELLRQTDDVIRAMALYLNAQQQQAEGGDDSEDSGTGGGGGASREVFARAIHAGARVHLNPAEVDILFQVFDADGSGTVDLDEMRAACSARARYNAPNPMRDFREPERNMVQTFVHCMQQR